MLAILTAQATIRIIVVATWGNAETAPHAPSRDAVSLLLGGEL
jgi:hypothetical protein